MSTPQEKAFIAHGHTFKNERDMNAYGNMLKEKRQKAKSRKFNMTPQEHSDAETRAFFAKEAKRFGR